MALELPAEENMPLTEPETRAPVLALKGVTKQFGDAVAVNDISFEVYDGEFLFLIGPSGCGKTTTLRMIGGYETPTSGEIFIRNRLVNNVPLDKRNIGMVFQSYALFPHMTVRQNIEFGLKTRKIPKKERLERAEAVLQLVELQDLGKRYPAQLSGGQRQRVALARVIVYEPDILLLDEPLANLDKRLRDVMRIELKKLQEKVGITTLYVTHDQEEALAMADRIVVMDQGNLLQVGAPSEVYNCPETSFVATFLGETTSFFGKVDQVIQGLGHVVTDDGLRLAVRLRNDAGAGDRLILSIRPERVRLSVNQPVQVENAFAGTVEFVEYLGAKATYLVRLGGGQVIEASEPIPSGQASFSEGDQVYASWDVDHVVYLKD
jgi:spermidine/putrescine ABC transporter ATP-binding subunit